MTPSIQHQADQHLFTTTVDGHQAYIDYHLDGSIMRVLHTIVPNAIGGRGIAGELTKFALETARQQGWTVVPLCSYTASYLKRHPEYADLLA